MSGSSDGIRAWVGGGNGIRINGRVGGGWVGDGGISERVGGNGIRINGRVAGGAWTRGRVGGGAEIRIRERIGGVVGSGLMNGWVGMMG